MKYLDIKSKNIKFKNLLSGPAPIGRILNYIYISKNSVLYHVNQHRNTTLKDNIGYAWTTEFMIGLEIFSLGSTLNNKTKLELTSKGMDLYNLIKKNYTTFTENGSRTKYIKNIKTEIDKYGPDLYIKLKEIFTNSFPFKVLCEFLKENGYTYENKKNFMNEFFESTKLLYDEAPTPYNKKSRTPTAENRVPSILQLLELFDMLVYDKNKIIFIKENIDNDNKITNIPIKEDILIEKAKKEELIIKKIEDLIKKYGEEGTVKLETTTRNNTLQKMFKHNLMISQNNQCIMCGIKTPDMLIGSHIKPVSSSTIKEKVDHHNGLLLCCNHDKLFDHYLITFNSKDGRIEISKVLTEKEILKLNVNKSYKLPEKLLTKERKTYLEHHNIEFYNREKNR